MSRLQSPFVVPSPVENDTHVLQRDRALSPSVSAVEDEWLLDVSQEYSALFEESAALSVFLSSFEKTVFLVDMDVIRNYIEARSASIGDTYYIDYLFQHARTHFAIPQGAWSELLEYLSRQYNLGRQIEHQIGRQELNREQTVQTLAKALGIQRQFPHEPLAARIAEALEERKIQLTRFIDMLCNPRFMGVVGKYREDHRSGWLQLVQDLPRHSEMRREFRDKRENKDKRDAVNLATATTSMLRGDTSAPRGVCYLLVSQTQLLFNATASVRECRRHSARETSVPDCLRSVSFQQPVVRPFTALALDILDATRKPRAAHYHATAIRKRFAELVEVQQQAILAKHSGADMAGGATLLLQEHQKKVRSSFSSFAPEGLSGPLRQIEECRSTGISIEVARRGMMGSEDAEDVLQRESTAFLRVLGRMAQTLEGMPSLDYTMVPVLERAEVPFRRLHMMQSDCGETAPPVLSLEIYHSRCRNDARPDYYSVRWPITCGNEDLIAGLRSILHVQQSTCRIAERAGSTTLLKPLSQDDDLWTEGLILATSSGSYAMDLSWVCADQQLATLTLPRLAKLLREIQTTDDAAGIPEVQRIRLNTIFGDFVFDVVPVDGSARRFMSVISHLNLSHHLTRLYARTGQLHWASQKFEACIGRALSAFLFPPERKEA